MIRRVAGRDAKKKKQRAERRWEIDMWLGMAWHAVDSYRVQSAFTIIVHLAYTIQEFKIDPGADPDAVCEWILPAGALPFSPLTALPGCKLLLASWFSSASLGFGTRISFFPLAL
jgi:hypothetical protein